MARLTLIVGNKNYSSWSLRGYLAVKASGLDFKEVVVPLRRPETRQDILAYSPSGLVPAIIDHGAGDIVVWESLAICEYLHEVVPAAGLWPRDTTARAHARASAAEMHAGFAALRRNLPMDITHDRRTESRADLVRDDISRITTLWNTARARFGAAAGGPFLYGNFCAADAMFAPVATRFRTYGVKLDAVSTTYCEAIFAHPAFKEWEAAALGETAIITFDVFQKAD